MKVITAGSPSSRTKEALNFCRIERDARYNQVVTFAARQDAAPSGLLVFKPRTRGRSVCRLLARAAAQSSQSAVSELESGNGGMKDGFASE